MARKKANGEKAAHFAEKLSGMKLLGEIVAWKAQGGPWTHTEVVAALKKSGLNHEIARDILPQQAFRRAIRKLEGDQVVDAVREDDKHVKFQLTKKFLEAGQMKYEKDMDLMLLKAGGKIECEDKAIKERVQSLVDDAIETRTVGDITNIWNKLLEDNTLLIPFHIGTYIVPIEHVDFILKVEAFIGTLGQARMQRLPIPAGTNFGNLTFQQCMDEHMQSLILNHMAAVDDFTVSTQNGTMDSRAVKIKQTRVLIQANAHHLQERANKLLEMIETANEKLNSKIEELTTERANRPDEEGKPFRTFLFNEPITSIIAWMGNHQWKFRQSRKALNNLGFQRTKDKAIESGLYKGKKTEFKIPVLKDEDIAKLEEARDRATGDVE